jgi:predicted PurR-regulated permease PerM
MSTANNHIKSRKQWPGILAALGMTAVLGSIIFFLGVNAIFNTNVTPVQAAGATDIAVTSDQATIEQLQSLIDQYQTREQQYQTELQQAADQLNQENAQLQQYQGLISALQNAGVIQISADGRVFIGSGGFGERQGGRDGD